MKVSEITDSYLSDTLKPCPCLGKIYGFTLTNEAQRDACRSCPNRRAVDLEALAMKIEGMRIWGDISKEVRARAAAIVREWGKAK
jgi:hypothetical protein